MPEPSGPFDTLDAAVRSLAADGESGASALVERAIAILREARAAGEPRTTDIARAVCAAQPSMASIWNAACAALGPDGDHRLARFGTRVRRAPAAMARFAVGVLMPATGGRAPSRLVTNSASGSVLACLIALRDRAPLTVACAEGRPRLEGRTLARQLAEAGLAVEFFTDAGLAVALPQADVVLVGADAISPAGVWNKCGTSALAAAAFHAGVPCYVAAGRDKFAGPAIAPRLRPRLGDPAEVWDRPPAGVAVRNPYFDATPLDLITGFITDVGLITPTDVASLCLAVQEEVGGSHASGQLTV